MKGRCVLATVSLLWLLPVATAMAEPGLTALTVKDTVDGAQSYTLSIQVLLLMSALTLLPAALIMMTSFTRIIIVLTILRQALGTAQTPTNQILVGLALFLTFFIMAPVFEQAHRVALQPYLQEKLTAEVAIKHATTLIAPPTSVVLGA